MSTSEGSQSVGSGCTKSTRDTNFDPNRKSETDGGTPDHEALKFEKWTMLFVDFRVLPLLSFLYAFCLIDRVNIGAAYVIGMGQELQLQVGARYSIATCIYFVSYIIFQLPGNIILRIVGVRLWLTFNVISWGAVQLGMGFVNSWKTLVVTRTLLGIFEAPFFPAMVFIISTWYKRHEVQKRMAVFFLISSTMTGVSPMLALAINSLDGRQNMSGWRWVFIIEGAITLFLGFIAWFFIPTFPYENRFLNQKQTELVLRRVNEDRGDAVPDPLTIKIVEKHLKDWKMWAFGITYFCASLPAYAQAFYISIILAGFGWSPKSALLLSAPPYGPPLITAMLSSWISDKYKHRSGFIIFQAVICIVGLVLTAFAGNNIARYCGTFLTTIGNAGTALGILAYSSNNVVSYSKRTVQSAVTVMFGGVAGIVATTVFRAQDFPRYIPGLVITITSQILLIVTMLLTSFHFWRQNKRLREGRMSEPLEGQPGFFYTL